MTPTATPGKARYIMIGGFLGAGKTTAVLKLAQLLRGRGLRVGLITNDQSYGLVDTAMLSSHGFPVEEIAGGCFCCKFSSLVDASQRLSERERPDVFIAEPVGSCTDLKATVDYPLRRMYGDDFAVAPLSVMIDPVRALRVLGLEAGKSFSPKVLYIYTKQLEEAEVVVINKTDLLTPERLGQLERELRSRFPAATILPLCAREGRGLDPWIEAITAHDPRTQGAMGVDYEAYAEGEALLGWMNCTVRLEATAPVDGNALLADLAGEVQRLLKADGVEIAHLKMTLAPEDDGIAGNDLAVANLVRSDAAPELSHRLQEPVEAGQLIVNLRAEADPEVLRDVTLAALGRAADQAKARHSCDVRLDVEHLERFRPGKPVPAHRLAGV